MQGPSRSQGGVKFPTGGMRAMTRKPASGFGSSGVTSRSGERPEPTVKVRMKENVQRAASARLLVIALGDVSVYLRRSK